jgi:hypothetical protein
MSVITNINKKYSINYFELIPKEIYEYILQIKDAYYALIVIAHTTKASMKIIHPLLKKCITYTQIKNASTYTSGNGYWKLYDWFTDHYSFIVLDNIVILNAAKQGNISFLKKYNVEEFILSDDKNMIDVIRCAILFKKFNIMRYYIHKICYRKKNDKFSKVYRNPLEITFSKFIDVLAQADNIIEYNWMKKSLNNKHTYFTDIIRNRGYNILVDLYKEYEISINPRFYSNEFINAAIASNDLRIFSFFLEKKYTVSFDNIISIVEHNLVDMLNMSFQNKEFNIPYGIVTELLFHKSLLCGSYDVFVYLTEIYDIPENILSSYVTQNKTTYFENPGTRKIMQILFANGYVPDNVLYNEIFKREYIDLLCIIDNKLYKEHVNFQISSGNIHNKMSIEFIKWLLNTFGDSIDVNKLIIIMIVKEELNAVKWLVKERNISIDSMLLIKYINSDPYIEPFFRIKMIEFLYIHGNLSTECWNIIYKHKKNISIVALKFIEQYMKSYLAE